MQLNYYFIPNLTITVMSTIIEYLDKIINLDKPRKPKPMKMILIIYYILKILHKSSIHLYDRDK